MIENRFKNNDGRFYHIRKKEIAIILLLTMIVSLFGYASLTNGVRFSKSSAAGGRVTKGSNSPKKIVSDRMVHFEVECKFTNQSNDKKYTYIYGYASMVEEGALIGLAYRKEGESFSVPISFSKLELVSKDIFAELNQSVLRHDFASNNGYAHFQYGSPENYGGEVNIRYASGEEIRFSDNQNSVISMEAGFEIVEILRKYMQTRYAENEYAGDIVALTYRDEIDQNNYTLYHLEKNRFVSESKFGRLRKRDIKVYPLNEDMLHPFRILAKESSILNWQGMRQPKYANNGERNRQMIFTMQDGSEIMIVESAFAPFLAEDVFRETAYRLNEMAKDADSGFPDKKKYMAPDVESIDYSKAYSEVLDRVCEAALYKNKEFANSTANSDLPNAYLGISKTASITGMQDKIGYVFFDINRDGVKELLIGVNDYNAYLSGTGLLAAFYFDGIEGRILDFGDYTKEWYLLDSGELYHHRAITETDQVEALFQLPEFGRKPECKEMYFSARSESGVGMEWYHSPNGMATVGEKGVVRVDEEEYFKFGEQCRNSRVYLELTPISHWKILE